MVLSMIAEVSSLICSINGSHWLIGNSTLKKWVDNSLIALLLALLYVYAPHLNLFKIFRFPLVYDGIECGKCDWNTLLGSEQRRP